jgi:hypothetical protein
MQSVTVKQPPTVANVPEPVLDRLPWKRIESRREFHLFVDTPGLEQLRSQLAKAGPSGVVVGDRYCVDQTSGRVIVRFPSGGIKE